MISMATCKQKSNKLFFFFSAFHAFITNIVIMSNQANKLQQSFCLWFSLFDWLASCLVGYSYQVKVKIKKKKPSTKNKKRKV